MSTDSIKNAKDVLSGVSRVRRIDQLEMDAVKPKMAAQPPKVPPSARKTLHLPKASAAAVSSRDAAIAAQQAADRAAIKAKRGY